MNWDRAVHVVRADGSEIVRYDRAGQWYQEFPPLDARRRVKINLATAVEHAIRAEREGGRVTDRRAGGMAFEAKLRKRRAELLRTPMTSRQIAEDLHPELLAEPARTRFAEYLTELVRNETGTVYRELARAHRLPQNLIADVIVASLGYAVWNETFGWNLTESGEKLVAGAVL